MGILDDLETVLYAPARKSANFLFSNSRASSRATARSPAPSA